MPSYLVWLHFTRTLSFILIPYSCLSSRPPMSVLLNSMRRSSKSLSLISCARSMFTLPVSFWKPPLEYPIRSSKYHRFIAWIWTYKWQVGYLWGSQCLQLRKKEGVTGCFSQLSIRLLILAEVMIWRCVLSRESTWDSPSFFLCPSPHSHMCKSPSDK